LDALSAGGITRKDVVFVCGYAEDVIRNRYPEFTYVRNAEWASNNILASLLCAREHFTGGFISTYADIVYDGEIVKKLLDAKVEIALGCDVAWRRRYVSRTQHPETDAEKMRAVGPRVVELSRRIESEAAQGEFIGVMKMSGEGAKSLADAYDAARLLHAGKVYREGRTFEKAYLIDLLEEMLEQNIAMHREDTNGAYMEIDTLEDLSMAEKWWTEKP
jgi:choline kinase